MKGCNRIRFYSSIKEKEMRNKTIMGALIAACLMTLPAMAQKTWIDVYTILNTGACNSPTCHGNGSPNPSFNVQSSPSVLYSQLVNGNPVNPYAKDSVHNKLVDPGSPQTSFIIRKLGRCTDGPLKLHQPNEGVPMPQNANRLAAADLE